MKKIKFVLFFCAFLLLFAAAPASASALTARADIFDDIAGMFVPKSQTEELGDVILGGVPIGISLDNDGIEVLGFTEIITDDGAVCPAENSGLRVGDKIVEVDGEKSLKIQKLKEACGDGGEISLSYDRGGKTYETEVTPRKDVLTGEYKLGLWVKDVSNGIGTLTFVKNGKYFGALGHPITSKDGDIVEITGGKVHDCVILGVEKGVKGAAGQLKGVFSNTSALGAIAKNNKFGVYGKFDSYPSGLDVGKLIPVADIGDVRPGKAEIYSTIKGETPECYEIEIVKVTGQSQKDDKGLVVRVTDSRLLDETGGIVQGMSGSPIVQNGKLVGAVTHVFINDPTRGFGMFAKWMLTE